MEILITIFLLMCYFSPAILAFNRNHASKWAILIVNLFFGVTFIGLIIAFI